MSIEAASSNAVCRESFDYLYGGCNLAHRLHDLEEALGVDLVVIFYF